MAGLEDWVVVLVLLGRPPAPLTVLGLAEDPPHGLRGLRLVADQLDRLGPALLTVTVIITHTIIMNWVQRNRDRYVNMSIMSCPYIVQDHDKNVLGNMVKGI